MALSHHTFNVSIYFYFFLHWGVYTLVYAEKSEDSVRPLEAEITYEIMSDLLCRYSKPWSS